MASEGARRRVVIVGAGFGGLAVARALRNPPVAVTVVDRRNTTCSSDGSRRRGVDPPHRDPAERWITVRLAG